MQIQVLREQGQATLVEWHDVSGPHRCVLPKTSVKDEQVEFMELEQGIPYGIPWETMVLPTVTPQLIARLLREKGIWTRRDITQHVDILRTAFQEAYSIDLKALLDSVRQLDAETLP